MRLYEAPVTDFNNDIAYNRITDILVEAFSLFYKKEPTIGEKISWNNSLRQVKDVLIEAGLRDNYIAIETEVPYTSRRIDVLLFGKNNARDDNIVLIELKQWDNSGVLDSEYEGNVYVKYRAGFSEEPHPSLKVEGYHYGLTDNYSIFEENPPVNLVSCVFCHNYSRKSEKKFLLVKSLVNTPINTQYLQKSK